MTMRCGLARTSAWAGGAGSAFGVAATVAGAVIGIDSLAEVCTLVMKLVDVFIRRHGTPDCQTHIRHDDFSSLESSSVSMVMRKRFRRILICLHCWIISSTRSGEIRALEMYTSSMLCSRQISGR